MTIRSEIEDLKAASDLLRAEDVVEWAQKHPESALHSAIEWDDTKAAHEYRIWQVRRLIAIHVEDDEGERKLISLSIDRAAQGGGYRDIHDVILSPEMTSVMLSDALAELRRVQTKYKRLKSLTKVWDEIDRVSRQANEQRMAS